MYELDNRYFNDYIYNSIDDYSNKIEVYYGGGGSGKSYGVLQKVLLKSLNDKRKVLFIRKIQRTIKNSIWSLVIEQLSDLGLSKASNINKSDYEITLPNKSVFLFSGLDDPEKIKSINGITDIVIEEATELTLDDYTQLLLRLRPQVDNPQIYLMFNPISKVNWVYDYFFINPPDNAKIIQSTYKDNKFITDDYREELERLKERNPAYYKIYTLGEFATLDRLVFPKITKKIISEEEIKGLPKIQGLDFGYAVDPNAIVWGYYDENNKRIYITGEYVKKGLLNDEIAEVMTDLGLAKEKTYGDSAEPKSIAELKRLGINIEGAVKGQDSVKHGIQWMQQHEIIIDERCFKTIEEFENYTLKKDKKTGEYLNEPVDTFNHTIDAIRYALNKYIKGVRSPKVYVKPIGL
jgi:phage terminase large subunit